MRIPFLQERTFYIDEAFSRLLASHNISGIIAGAASESNPPLPVFLFHFWQSWASAEWELRLLCLLLSVAAVVVIYFFTCHIAGRTSGIFAAALAAVSAYQLDFAQIYRYPALLILLGAVGYYLLWRWSQERDNRLLTPLALVFILGLYTHYFYGFLILGANLYVIVAHRRDKKQLAAWLVAQAVAAATFIPWMLAFMGQAGGEIGVVPVDKLVIHLKTLPFFAVPHILESYSFGSFSLETHIVFAVFAVIVYVLIFYQSAKYPSRKEVFFVVSNLGMGLFLPYFMMLFLGLRLQVMYFCVFSPLFYAGVAIAFFGNKWVAPCYLRYGAAAGLVILMLCSVVSHFIRLPVAENNKTIISHIEDNWREGDVVVINPAYQASLFEYYAQKPLKTFGIPGQFDIMKYNFQDTTQVSAARLAELDDAVAQDGRVWAFYGFGPVTKPDQEERTMQYMRENFEFVYEKSFTPASFAGPVGRLYLFSNTK